ncbi:hypothetical protein [uncultured Litoreibacter sp.]|uniref:hypothetical protein n=1 Tax=uncultured Litoreibacter sp. TaxID=1392394 RepID=UPI002620E082|nr:hypothetical protein [uncultured Litoreibacter sp.]
MKITRNTPEQLIVGENPVWVAVLLVSMGMIFLGIGLSITLSGELMGLIFAAASLLPFSFLFIFVRRVQLIFEASKGTLTIQRKNLRAATTVVHDLTDVQGAELETSHGDNSRLYRVTLVLTGQSAGRHPITQAYSNVGNHQGVHDAINAWLDSLRART